MKNILFCCYMKIVMVCTFGEIYKNNKCVCLCVCVCGCVHTYTYAFYFEFKIKYLCIYCCKYQVTQRSLFFYWCHKKADIGNTLMIFYGMTNRCNNVQ